MIHEVIDTDCCDDVCFDSNTRHAAEQIAQEWNKRDPGRYMVRVRRDDNLTARDLPPGRGE